MTGVFLVNYGGDTEFLLGIKEKKLKFKLNVQVKDGFKMKTY